MRDKEMMARHLLYVLEKEVSNETNKIKLGIISLVAFFLFAFLECFLIIPRALAEEKIERSEYWGSIDFGIGFVQRSSAEIEEDDTNFFFDLKVEQAIDYFNLNDN